MGMGISVPDVRFSRIYADPGPKVHGHARRARCSGSQADVGIDRRPRDAGLTLGPVGQPAPLGGAARLGLRLAFRRARLRRRQPSGQHPVR